MAALVDFCWFSSSLLSLSLLFTVSNTSENKTEHSLNITLFGDQNATYNDTDSYSTTPPTGFDSSTPKPADSSTEEPTKPTVSVEPLPVSGVLPAPVVNIGRLCPCDEHQDMCDINCCCDRECREEVALFTSCSVPTGHKLLSLTFASEHLNDPEKAWEKVWSDETKVELFGINSTCCVCRMKNCEYDPKNTIPTVKHGSFGAVFVGKGTTTSPH
uniref:Tectonic-1-3 N-terminal domain-containing protein n=1 Tax=Mola mola TaxID=94237 RepID=A0A3Q3VM83_MOLML